MKIGDKVKFFLFGVEETGIIYDINKKEKTISAEVDGFKYPGIQTFKKLPKNKKDVPPWYLLKQ